MEIHTELNERLATILGDELEIERELGGGGMSRVFVAFDKPLNRRVVVKVLPDEIATAISRERFRREILTSATLQHPNIVPVISAGDKGGLIHFIMPFVEGESLRARIMREGTLTPVNVVSIMRDVARALAYAHERGVVHRDIKPDNVLLSGGTAVVADFGVAKAFASARESTGEHATLTNVGMSLGTPAYMAPEQVAGDSKLDARTDLYALGVMAYEALCGRPVFPRESVASVLRAHLTDTPEPPRAIKPRIPAALEDAVMRCLEKDPAARPQSANELLAILENPAVLSGAFTLESQARSSGTWGVSVPRGSMWKLGALGLVVVAALVAGFSLLGGRGTTAPVATARPAVPTIAVLPLLSVSTDSSGNYLAFGVTDEIINALARIGGVRVTSRSAATDAQRQSLSLNQLAERLGVTHALEGTLQRQGNEVHVAVRLVNTSDGLTAWSEVFDGTTDEVFDMQRYIAGAVADAVRKDLGPKIDSTLGGGYQPAPAAHDAYLRAHYELSRRGDGDLTGAVTQLRKAVSIDSQYAVAWAELSQALTILPLYGKGDPIALQEEAMRSAQRALAIDSMLPAAHAALGNLLNAQWRWRDGEVSLRRAVALDSSYAPALQWLGENRLLNGDIPEAERLLARAVRIDSTLSVTRAVHGLVLALLKRAADADREVDAAVTKTPSVAALHVMKGAAFLYTNRISEAVAALEVARVIDPQSSLVLGTLGYAYGRAGNTNGLAEIERTLLAMKNRPGVGTALAKIKLSVGDTAAAMDYLEQALRSKDPLFAAEPLRSPVYAPLHRSERFGRIVQAAGLDRQRVTAPGCC
jgi:serine/threonine-protein kinase